MGAPTRPAISPYPLAPNPLQPHHRPRRLFKQSERRLFLPGGLFEKDEGSESLAGDAAGGELAEDRLDRRPHFGRPPFVQPDLAEVEARERGGDQANSGALQPLSGPRTPLSSGPGRGSALKKTGLEPKKFAFELLEFAFNRRKVNLSAAKVNSNQKSSLLNSSSSLFSRRKANWNSSKANSNQKSSLFTSSSSLFSRRKANLSASKANSKQKSSLFSPRTHSRSGGTRGHSGHGALPGPPPTRAGAARPQRAKLEIRAAGGAVRPTSNATADARDLLASIGGRSGDRTLDPRIKSPLLYQLS